MNTARLLFLTALLLASAPASAFEADVHYGLTHWLALQAGFDPLAAQIIATGDQRVDSGDMQYIDVIAMYACLGKDDVGAKRAGSHHYPTAGSVPGPLETRAVSPGSDAARKAAVAAIKVPPGQAAYMLHKLGEALHTLQDSWSHQGIPDVPRFGDGAFGCDVTRAWGHPKTRGGASSHRADLTSYWPADTIAMAKATYDILTQYPLVSGNKRTARPWEEIRPALDGFIKASSKTDKAGWFVAHGVSDVSFLEGINLPNGPKAFDQQWPGRKLPPLATKESRQHAVDADVLDFYNRFFARWLGTEDFGAIAAEFGAHPDGQKGKNAKPSAATAANSELAMRLKVWRLRDHGRVAELAHTPGALTARQRASLDAIAKRLNAYARYPDIAAAYFPLLPHGNDVSPLLPFFISVRTPAGGQAQAMAVAKFRHAPYDVVGVVAKRLGGRWRVVSIVSTVDH
jgi:hypothetical protein